MQVVVSTDQKDPSLYYGAPCQPTLKGLLWECTDRAEYLTLRAAYEAEESNCNTCRHLKRMKQDKPLDGYLLGTCSRSGLSHCRAVGKAIVAGSQPGGETVFRFHPDDPLHMPCWESRR